MFKRLKLIIENNQLKQKNKILQEENRLNRNDIENLEFKKFKARMLANETLHQLNLLQDIDHRGYSQEEKQKNRNVIINNLRKQNINIIKELAETGINN